MAQIILSNEADVAVCNRIGRDTSHEASTLGVIANTVAYNEGEEWRDGVLGYLDSNRPLLSEHLTAQCPEIGYRQPEGTFVAWLDCRNLEIDASPAEFFRENAGAALTDGAS